MELKYFKSFLGEWLAIGPWNLKREIWYSANGFSFYKLFMTGHGTNGHSVEHAQFDWNGKVKAEGGTFVLTRYGSNDAPIFRPVPAPVTDMLFVDLPHTLQLHGLYSITDGQIVCWAAYKYYFDYETSTVFVGRIGDMKSAKPASFKNLQLITNLGVLDFNQMTWEGYKLTNLDASNYDITFDNGNVSISEK